MIKLLNVNKSYGEKNVLQNFSLELEEGSRTCIMGRSGEGKTTLLNLLLGLVKPDSGEITGVPSDLSAVFQEDRLCESFSAFGNILAVTDKRISNSEITALLSDLGLPDIGNKPVSELSGGMRRRVAIARALLAESDLIILDEPFKGLDEATRQQVITVILSRIKNKTLLIATHDPRDAEAFSARIINI